MTDRIVPRKKKKVNAPPFKEPPKDPIEEAIEETVDDALFPSVPIVRKGPVYQAGEQGMVKRKFPEGTRVEPGEFFRSTKLDDKPKSLTPEMIVQMQKIAASDAALFQVLGRADHRLHHRR